jgi:ABC-type sugar transport system permease subunit
VQPGGRVWLSRSVALFSLGAALFSAVPLTFALVASAGSAVRELALLSAWREPVVRSLLLMIIGAPLCTLGGFILGAKLADTRMKMGVSSSLLILPTLLGSGVNAFIFKLCFTDISMISATFESRNVALFWVAVVAMIVWQYVPCVAFFCWLSCMQVSSERRAFAAAHKFTFAEKLADIYWPRCQNLLIYLFLLVSASCAAEFERTSLVFRASAGTGTEFFSHWILRSYFMITRTDPLLASAAVLFYTTVFASVCIPIVGLSCMLGARVVPRGLRSFGWFIPGNAPPSDRIGPILLTATLFVIGAPFLPAIVRGGPVLTRVQITNCVVFIAFPAAFASLACAAATIIARLGWPSVFSAFNRVSVALCLVISSAGFLPPVALAFTGMWWMQNGHFLGTASLTPVVIVWWVLLCFGSLPMFLPGYLATQYVVTTNELAFQRQHLATFAEVTLISFVRRLWPIYLLFGTFMFGFMWTEYPLTAIFSGLSPEICSPILGLAVRVEGKAAEFNEAAAIILQLSAPLVIFIAAFGAWMSRTSATARGA